MIRTRTLAFIVSLSVNTVISITAIAQQSRAQAPENNALPPAAPPNAVSGPVPQGNSVTALPHEGGVTLSATDETFVQKAAQGGIAEVQLAQLAQQKSQSGQVKQFAQKMIDDHAPNNQQLVKLAASKDVSPPSEPDSTQQKMESRLEGLSGRSFDRAYVKGQIHAHETMLKLFKAEAANGRDADLKSFAAQTVPVIQAHLSLAEQLRKAGA